MEGNNANRHGENDMNLALTIAEATFSEVETDNRTTGWMFDDAALNSGKKILSSGEHGFAVILDGRTVIDLYASREAAQAHINRI